MVGDHKRWSGAAARVPQRSTTSCPLILNVGQSRGRFVEKRSSNVRERFTDKKMSGVFLPEFAMRSGSGDLRRGVKIFNRKLGSFRSLLPRRRKTPVVIG